MTAMVPLEAALQRMLDEVEPLTPRPTPLADADGCRLAEDCRAKRTQPPYDVSAMDGYALHDAPVAGAQLTVIGEAPAGGRFDGTVREGEAVRIFTGAPMPTDAPHVVIQEEVVRDGDTITLSTDGGGKNHVRPAGGDFAEGDVLVPGGTVLTPQHLMLAASGNHAELTVVPRPSLLIVMNGNELRWPGDDVDPDAIIASNGFALAALARRFGARHVAVELLPDDLTALTQTVSSSIADIVVTIGGASVGDHDLVRPALTAAGFSIDVPKVALRPGKPTLFGKRGNQCALGLPGNPVSALVSALIFLRPLMLKLSGDPRPDPLLLEPATLGVDLPANGPRAHFMRATRLPNGRFAPVQSQDSSLMKLLASANALIYRAVDAPQARAGDACSILALPV